MLFLASCGSYFHFHYGHSHSVAPPGNSVFPDSPLGSVHFHKATGFHHCSLWFSLRSLSLPSSSVAGRRQPPLVHIALVLSLWGTTLSIHLFSWEKGHYDPLPLLFFLVFSFFMVLSSQDTPRETHFNLMKVSPEKFQLMNTNQLVPNHKYKACLILY